MHLLLDENVPAPSIALIRGRGYDLLSIAEDHSGLGDPDVIALARRLGRVLVTFDSDIGERIFKDGDPSPPRVLYLRFIQSDPEETARVVLDILSLDPPVLDGRFVTYRNGRIRLQPLP